MQQLSAHDKLFQLLFDAGLFDHQATAILSAATPAILELVPAVKLSEPGDAYPVEMYELIYQQVLKAAALKWMDEHKPNHWARPIFESSL